MGPLSSGSERQAVVVIHGIGEQEPMETLREFVASIVPEIKNNPLGVKEKFYVKPDELSELFDLRRITIPNDKKNGRLKTDFYEYYWAHQIRDTKIDDVLNWIAGVFLGWRNVPKRLKTLHTILLILIVLIPIIAILIIIIYPNVKNHWFAFVAASAGSVYFGARLLRSFVNTVSINFIGDAACYFAPKPGNVINRQNIRKEGLRLLRKLHGEQEGVNGEKFMYKKIVVVAHSLGSVIAYDLLSILWSNYHDQFGQFSQEHQEKLGQMEDKLIQLEQKSLDNTIKETDWNEFITLQEELMQMTANAGNPWRVTDFVTLGSPLSHAQLLMAKGKESLVQMQKERQYPTCPPTLEAQNVFSYAETFDFGNGLKTKLKIPHHAALFALTRWTNIWFRNDFVGGPMRQSFGNGIIDNELVSKTHKTLPFLSHTFYWDKREFESVNILRDIIF